MVVKQLCHCGTFHDVFETVAEQYMYMNSPKDTCLSYALQHAYALYAIQLTACTNMGMTEEECDQVTALMHQWLGTQAHVIRELFASTAALRNAAHEEPKFSAKGVPMDGDYAFNTGWDEKANPYGTSTPEDQLKRLRWRADWCNAHADSWEEHIRGADTIGPTAGRA